MRRASSLMIHAGARAVLLATLLLPASSSQADPRPASDDGTDEFRAFVAETREKKNTTRVEELELERRRLERGLILRGRVYVRLLRSGLLPLSDGFEEMVTHTNRVERLRRSLMQDVLRRNEVHRRQRELEAGIKELRTRRAKLARNLAEYERSREAILAARDREAAFQRAFEAGWEPADHTAIYAAPPSPDGVPANFASSKGHLPLPVAGRAEVRPVRLPNAMGPGAFLAVAPGSPVVAVFGGRVVLTGQYGELGRSVVLDHGEGFSTLSARVGAVTVEVGDVLEAGESLGSLAESADGNLYFEVRHHGTPLDPADWFGF